MVRREIALADPLVDQMSLQTAQELCEEDKVLLVLSGCLVLLFREEHVLIGQRLLNCVFIFGDVAGKVVQLLVLE